MDRDYIVLKGRTEGEIKDLKENEKNGGTTEWLNSSGNFQIVYNPNFWPNDCYRKASAPKLTKEQIMNDWLWDREIKEAFKIIRKDGNLYYSNNTSGGFCYCSLEVLREKCELYTGQDEA